MLREYIIERRKEIQMSQEELANRVGVRRSTISDFENGKSSLRSEKLEEICKVLNFKLYQESEVYRLEMWDKAKYVASVLQEKTLSDLQNMTKEKMYELTDEKFLLNFDDILKTGQLEDEKTYSYFNTLVCFHHALLKREAKKSQDEI